jgi:hypothetical protein
VNVQAYLAQPLSPNSGYAGISSAPDRRSRPPAWVTTIKWVDAKRGVSPNGSERVMGP